MFCTYCGAHLTGGERFCPGCGAALLPAEAAGPSVQRPSAAPQGTAEQGWQQPAYTGYMPSWPPRAAKNALAGCILCAGVWEGGRHGEGQLQLGRIFLRAVPLPVPRLCAALPEAVSAHVDRRHGGGGVRPNAGACGAARRGAAACMRWALC